jgi:cellulose biosynthesis protein BcsQ
MCKSLLSVLAEDGHAFSAKIPQSVKLIEAETEGAYIGDYAKESNAHVEVRKFAKEVVKFFKDQDTETSKSASQAVNHRVAEGV